jgi:hypothetical protein
MRIAVLRRSEASFLDQPGNFRDGTTTPSDDVTDLLVAVAGSRMMAE